MSKLVCKPSKLDNRYKCPDCGERFTLSGLKHVAVCRNCYEVIDVDKLREQRNPKEVSGQSVLDKILGCGIPIASMSTTAILDRILV